MGKINFFAKEERKRGWRYLMVGTFTFAIDLILLYILVEFGGMREFISAGIAFAIVTTLNYLLNRKFAFSGTQTNLVKGFRYFILFALGGVLVISGLMYLAVDVWELNYIISRWVIAVIVGIITYFFNYFFTFKLHERDGI